MPFDELRRHLLLAQLSPEPRSAQAEPDSSLLQELQARLGGVLRKESRTDASVLSSMGNPAHAVFADTVCEIGFRKFGRVSASRCSRSVGH
jgi:hypothetical protein